jgi:predicted transcriptional regulator of viral defense system
MRRTLVDYAAALPSLGVPVIRTRDFAMRFDLKWSAATETLSRLAAKGLIRRIARGAWSTTAEVDPFAVASHLFTPNTSYGSMRSAMNIHAMISQVPNRIEVIATGAEGLHRTAVGDIDVRAVQGGLITGFEVKGARKVALPEKAIFDFLYLRRRADAARSPRGCSAPTSPW